MSGFELENLVTRGKLDGFVSSEEMSKACFKMAFEEIVSFLKNEMLVEVKRHHELESLESDFNLDLKSAQRSGLIGSGGVPEKNYLALWLISAIIKPDLYVESGFYKGSSIHAVSRNSRKIIGFDPNHKNYKAELVGHNNIELHSHDFRQHDFGTLPQKTLLYFDDHINTAKRIIQASSKGYKLLIFDDSCGLMGTSERMWPALPSIFFINNIDKFKIGDYVEWPKSLFREKTFLASRIKLRVKTKSVQNRFEITKEVVELCNEAKSLIKISKKIPEMNDYIVTPRALPVNDTSQHMVSLK